MNGLGHRTGMEAPASWALIVRLASRQSELWCAGNRRFQWPWVMSTPIPNKAAIFFQCCAGKKHATATVALKARPGSAGEKYRATKTLFPVKRENSKRQ